MYLVLWKQLISIFSLERGLQMATSSSKKISSICVLTGARLGINKEFQVVGTKLGRALAKNKINLVYEGCTSGLMGNVALAASLGGTGISGIILTTLKRFYRSTMGKEIEVSSITERMPTMLEHSDAFIALPSGLSTFHDILHIGYWLALTIHSKPIGLLNVNGYYDGLLTFLDHAVEQGFMDQTVRQVFLSDSDPEQLIEKLQVFEFKCNHVGSQVDWFGNSNKRKKVDLDLRLSL